MKIKLKIEMKNEKSNHAYHLQVEQEQLDSSLQCHACPLRKKQNVPSVIALLSFYLMMFQHPNRTLGR